MGWLKWQPAVGLALGSCAVGLVWWRSTIGWQHAVATFSRELALVLGLYTIWILAGRLSVVRVDEGLANGRWVYHAQQTLHLPTEVHLQDWLIDHSWVARFTNGYYAIVHAPAMMITLLWLFFTYSDKYPHWRTVLAITTFACLVIQFVPVAPPRMYTQFGFVDVARLFDQSVYGPIGQGISDQLSAMPSVHVAWALWVAVVVIAAAHHALALADPAPPDGHRVRRGRDRQPLVVRRHRRRVPARVRGRDRQPRPAARRRGPGPPALGASGDVQPADELVGANDGLVPAFPMSTSSGSRRSST